MSLLLESTPKTRDRVTPLKVSIAAILLCIGASIIAVMVRSNITKSDYITYWAAGQRIVHRHNPYDGNAVFIIEKSIGYLKELVRFLVRNPPWGLFITLPLGFVGPVTGSFVWSAAMLAMLMAAIHLLRRKYATKPSDLHFVGYAFPPVIFCMMQGQAGIFLLLSFAVFICMRESRPYAAGAALALLAIKPHLFIPLGAVFIVWVFFKKTYPVLVGASAAIALASLLAVILDPSIMSDYLQMVRTSQIQDDFIPTVSQLIRLAINPQAAWIQTVPAALGTVWGVVYFWKHRDMWDWSEHGMILLLVSIMLAPYAWFADQSVLLATMLIGLYRTNNTRAALLTLGFLFSVCIVEMTLGVAPRSWFYVWTTPAWLLWYVFSRKIKGSVSDLDSKLSSVNS